MYNFYFSAKDRLNFCSKAPWAWKSSGWWKLVCPGCRPEFDSRVRVRVRKLLFESRPFPVDEFGHRNSSVPSSTPDPDAVPTSGLTERRARRALRNARGENVVWQPWREGPVWQRCRRHEQEAKLPGGWRSKPRFRWATNLTSALNKMIKVRQPRLILALVWLGCSH